MSGCDLLHRRRKLKSGQEARCQRCHHVLQTCKPFSVERALAASLAASVFLLISLFTPFLSLSRSGVNSSISVLDAVRALWDSQMRWLGLLTLALIVLLPLSRLILMSWVLWSIRYKRRRTQSLRTAFRWVVRLEPWAMADIFMVGVAVSLVKISTLATLSLGPAFWALLALVATTLFADLSLCKDTVWARLDPHR